MDAMAATGRKAPHLITLIFLCGLSIVSLNLFLPSLPAIAEAFQADYALVSLSIAGYVAVTAVLQVIVGPLSDLYGRRPVILWGVALFCVASAGCLLSTDVETFLVFRMLQSGIIAGIAVSRAVVMDIAGPERAAAMMGTIASAWAIAPMLGPMIGGTLDHFFGWQSNFWAFLGLGLALLAICWVDLHETNHNRAETFSRQMRNYPKLLGARAFWGYSLSTSFAAGSFYCYIGGAPLVAAEVFGIGSAELGFAIGAITGGFMTGSFIAGRLSGRFGLITMMLAGRCVALFGLLAGLLFLAAGVVHPVSLFGCSILVGIGNGISAPGSSAGAMAVRRDLAGSASGLSGAMVNAVGAALAAMTAAVLTPENAAWGLLGMMLLSTVLSALAILLVRGRG
ncbi:MAG: Bcr/CflA family efflux MFS transporter [Pseudomonadota bacterium]|nr:Bcr/CflA family efflux MFS transporter [Pseudomonadota bacterium]